MLENFTPSTNTALIGPAVPSAATSCLLVQPSQIIPPPPAIELRLLTLNRRHNLARVPTGPELQVPDPLPRPCRQLPIGDGDIDRRANQRGLDMSL